MFHRASFAGFVVAGFVVAGFVVAGFAGGANEVVGRRVGRVGHRGGDRRRGVAIADVIRAHPR